MAAVRRQATIGDNFLHDATPGVRNARAFFPPKCRRFPHDCRSCNGRRHLHDTLLLHGRTVLPLRLLFFRRNVAADDSSSIGNVSEELGFSLEHEIVLVHKRDHFFLGRKRAGGNRCIDHLRGARRYCRGSACRTSVDLFLQARHFTSGFPELPDILFPGFEDPRDEERLFHCHGRPEKRGEEPAEKQAESEEGNASADRGTFLGEAEVLPGDLLGGGGIGHMSSFGRVNERY